MVKLETACWLPGITNIQQTVFNQPILPGRKPGTFAKTGVVA
jgi:hypothetical protein